MGWISISCFCAMYFTVFFLLIILINTSCYLSGLIAIIGKLVTLSTISWIATKYLKKQWNKELISSHKKAVLITGKFSKC